ncbi:MAG: hypothetical protein AAF573_10445 [Bacteroidota bacterium]
MKKYCYLLLLTMFLGSCEHSVLDKPFYADYYEGDFPQLVQEKKLTHDDVFLINYTITRQRDYFNYELETKSYGEILKMAKDFKENGMGVAQIFDKAETQPYLKTTITEPDIAYLEKEGNSKRKVKFVKFSCLYENVSDQEIALNYTTFIVNGIFQQHIATVGYEMNCKIPARSKQKIHYIINGKDIRRSLRFGRANKVKRMMMDDVMVNLNFEIGGIVVDDKDASLYDGCFMSGAVIEPFKISSYRELFPDGIQPQTVNGKPTINFGPRIFTQDSDGEVIRYE